MQTRPGRLIRIMALSGATRARPNTIIAHLFLISSAAVLPAAAPLPAFVPLVAALGDLEEELRRNFEEVLGQMGAESTQLARSLGAGDPEIRERAARSLGEIGRPAIAAAPSIAEVLAKDPNKEVRKAALDAFVKLGPPARKAVPALVTALADKDPEIRASAIGHLRLMGPRAMTAIPGLVDLLRKGERMERVLAASALGAIARPGITIDGSWGAGKPRPKAAPVKAASKKSAKVASPQGAVEFNGRSSAVADAVGALRDSLKDPNLRGVVFAALCCVNPRLEPAGPVIEVALRDRDDGVRRAAEEGAGKIDDLPGLAASLGRIFERTGDPKLLVNAGEALSALGAPAVPSLVRLLEHGDFQHRQVTVGALERIGPEAREARPLLEKAAKEPMLKASADKALRAIGRGVSAGASAVKDAPGTKPADIRSLAESLGDGDPFVSSRAAAALAALGPAAAEAPGKPDVEKAMKERLRFSVAALGNIGQAAAPAVPDLVLTLKASKHDPDLPAAAASALGRIGPAAAGALPALIDALRENDPRVMGPAVFALSRMGPDGESQVVAALESKSQALRKSAAAALINLGGTSARKAVPVLLEALKEHRDLVWAMELLERIGPADDRVLNAMAAFLRTADRDACELVPSALARIGRPAVPALIAALTEKSPEVRRAACRALGMIGPDAQEAVPSLLRAMEDPDASVRQRAATTLGNIGPGAVEAVPAFIEWLKDPNTSSQAAYLFERIGPAAAPRARQAIIEARERGTLGSRVAARVLLGLGSPDRKALLEIDRLQKGDRSLPLWGNREDPRRDRDRHPHPRNGWKLRAPQRRLRGPRRARAGGEEGHTGAHRCPRCMVVRRGWGARRRRHGPRLDRRSGRAG
jgi:HEAT repeat protein